VIDKINALGVSYDDVVATLESEGVEKFKVSWTELEDTVRAQLDQASRR
jgi:transaldolase